MTTIHRQVLVPLGFALIIGAACNQQRPRSDGKTTSENADSIAIQAGTERNAKPGSTCLQTPAVELTYSNVVEDPETLDKSGAEITFVSENSRLVRARYREAAGEFGPNVEAVDLRFDTLTKALRFGMPHGKDTATFDGTFECDSIWGNVKAYSSTPPELLTYRRVRPLNDKQ